MVNASAPILFNKNVYHFLTSLSFVLDIWEDDLMLILNHYNAMAYISILGNSSSLVLNFCVKLQIMEKDSNASHAS
jgi:hypothetical protein